ncbi:beta strand repeat-containing protein [Collimonas sp. NPDC087041]|uniref:beta strand repeat-containing protein n=1 Tax=Collimonas sp. NPDC087041 TaxID=3363960 RepID=UPI0037FF5C87
MNRSLRQLLSRLDQSRMSNALRLELPVDRTETTGENFLGLSQNGAPQIRLWQRAVAATLATTLWLAPLQVSWHNATQSAAQLAVSEETQRARNSAVDWQFFAGQLKQGVLQAQQSGNWVPLQAQLEERIPGITRVLLANVKAALPSVQLGLRSAVAGPITDPNAPIRFQPQITSTTGPNGAVPVVNITQPNGAGQSLNQYSSFNVDAVGLILNNSLTSGGSLTGGNVSANPLLNGRTATQIINQVTSQGSPSNIFGTIEVFGAPASVIVINPNGVNCTGCGVTNAPHFTLTTGTPQFLTGPGGTVTSFDNASALAYNVQGGHIQIEGLPGANGTPGAGIEGTVGVIDLIGGSIGVNAPLYAGQQVNLISGQQVVAQAQPGQGRAGSDYQVSSNGPNTAASNTSAQNSYQIDATAFGAISAGQIKIIGTSQGLGVRNDGTLTSSVGATSIDANGDVRVGATYGQTTVGITSTGNVTANGDSVGEQGLSIAANGNLQVNGNMQSQQSVNLQAGGGISGTGGAVANAITATAGNSLSLGGAIQATTSLNLTAQGHDGTGDITLGGSVTAPSVTAINAARDITIDGSMTSTGALTLAATRNLTVNGTAGSVGDLSLQAKQGGVTTTGNVISTTGNVGIVANTDANLGGLVYAAQNAQLQSQQGSVTVDGTVGAQGTLQVSAAQNVTLGGTTQAGGNTTITATSGDVNIAGDLTGHGAGTVTAGGNIAGAGNTQFTNNASLTAGSNIGLAGTVGVGGNLNAIAKNNLALGATTVIGNATLAATQGNLNLNGATTTGGNILANAGTDLVAAGAVNGLQNITLNAGRNLTTEGTVGASNNLTATAGQALALNGVTTSLGNATLTGSSIATGGDLNVAGTLQATAQNSLNLTGGLLTVGKDANLTGADITVGGTASATSITAANPNPVNAIGGNLTATATNSVTTNNVGVVKGNATLNGANSVTNNGNWLAAGDLNITTQQATNSAGAALQSLGTTTINAANLTNAGSVYGVNTNVNASNSVVNTNGALLARDNLNVVTNTFAANQGGLLFAGDTSTPSTAPAGSGNVSLTVNGPAGSFDNTNGQILAANNVTLNLPNQTIDPSAASFGNVDLNGTLTLIANAINVNGNWNLPGSGLNLQASNGFTNTGTIQKSGNISISGASFTNSGNVIAGGDVSLNGVVTNQAGGVIHADQDVNLAGTVANAGTIEAVRDVNVSGASYDNTGGTTTANRDFNATLSGTLTNVGSTITAGNNVNITAASVNNNRAAPIYLQNTTTTVIDPALLGQAVVGIQEIQSGGGCTGQSTCPPVTYTPQNVTLDQLNPDYAAGTLTAVKATEFYGQSDTNGSLPSGTVWHFAGDNPITQSTPTTVVLNLPTVQTTTQSQANGQQGLITAGNQTSITANSLSNQGSTISGNNVVLNVQSLDNGRSASVVTSLSTSTVDQTALNNLIAQITALGVTALGQPILNQCENPSDGSCSGTLEPTLLTPSAPGTSVAPTTGGTTTALGVRGQIVANQDVSISGGNLVNAGNIVAGRDVTFNVASLTNQGETSYNVNTQGSLVVANSNGLTTSDNFNPLSQTIAITQDPATIVAGRNLAITAGSVTNNNANLAAVGNVTITSPGAVNNQSGTIQATNGDVSINAGQLNNVRSGGTVGLQSRQTTFAGQTVQDLNQDFFGVTQQAETSLASVITSGGNVNINAATLNNNGSLINAGQNANITVTSSLNNAPDVLAVTSYHSHVENVCGVLGCDHVRENDPVNNNTPNESNSIIQAVGSLNVNGQNGQYAALQNSGTLSAYQVNLTGSSITNGFTNPQIVTPAGTSPQNVVPLGPIGTPTAATAAQNGANQAAGQSGAAIVGNGSGPQAPTGGAIGSQGYTTASTETVANGAFHFTAGTPAGQSGLPMQSSSNAPQYVVTSPASSVLGGLTPQVLLNSLPAALQPNGNVPFYYDPYTEDQQLQQAALAQTGNASFISGLTPDAQTQMSITDQEKAVLYSNAISYATQNNIQVGQALSQQQINALTAPMLWYVEETVPDPSCKATGTFQCGTINALMPQVYLPQATPSALTGGVIQGNQVTLTATGTGTAQDPNGTVTNTGYISAQQLIINAGELDNEARSANIGVQTISAGAQGYTKLTGTEVQPGGFLSAANYQLNVDRVNSISGQFQQLNADGTVNQAGSQALLDNLQQQLGGDFTQSTAQNDITQTWVQTKKSDPATEIVMAVAAVALSIVTAGAAAAAIGAMEEAAATTMLEAVADGATFAEASAAGGIMASSSFAVGGFANAAIAGAVGAMSSSAFTQLATTGNLSIGQIFKAGAVGGLTAGLTTGVTYDNGSVGIASEANDPNSLANLAGAQSVGNGLTGNTVTQAGDSTAATLGTRVGAVLADSTISAGVQTLIDGGSFGNALKNSLVQAGAAAGAYAIGNEAAEDGSLIAPGTPGYVLAHGLLGCAASAAGGTGCASGAIGGATSAAVTPFLLAAMDPNATALSPEQTAALTALSMLAGGGVAALAGQNATTAAQFAENETLNNDLASLLHIQSAVTGAKNAASWMGTATSAFLSSLYGSVKETALMVYDGAYQLGGPGSLGPQSGVNQSLAQNGAVATGQAIVSNLKNTAIGVSQGDPTAIGSTAATVVTIVAGGLAGGEADVVEVGANSGNLVKIGATTDGEISAATNTGTNGAYAQKSTTGSGTGTYTDASGNAVATNSTLPSNTSVSGGSASTSGSGATVGANSAGTAGDVAASGTGSTGPLFRGTSPGYPGNPVLQELGITPTSTDPGVATVFATGSATTYGNGVVHIATSSDLAGVNILPAANTSSSFVGIEAEVAVGVPPTQFADTASVTITAAQARGILADMGINVPAYVPIGDVTNTLQSIPKLTPAQTQQFINAAKNLAGGK